MPQATQDPADQPSVGQAIAQDHGPTVRLPSWLDSLDDTQSDAANNSDEELEGTLDMLSVS
jgi:hypothetical protein